jgi:starch phosphorylase
MRESMARLTPQYSANRAVREYTENHYIPAAVAYNARSAEAGKLGAELSAWHSSVAKLWPSLRFGQLRTELKDGQMHFEVPVYGESNPAVRVELYAEPNSGRVPFRQAMDRSSQTADGAGIFTTSVPATRDPHDFTPRVVPFHDAARVPLEANQIVWYK